MSLQAETAALVALLRSGRRPGSECAALVEERGEAQTLLEEDLGLLAEESLSQAAADVQRWNEQGLRALTVLDPEYPENLRGVHDRPALIFVAGQLAQRDARSVALIGSRRASSNGTSRARALSKAVVGAG